MPAFSIEDFAVNCKAAMNAADDREAAARNFLAKAIEVHGPQAIQEALEAAVPEGASVGEMVVFADSELTMLYARAPGRFQSPIHDHTVFACMGQLEGAEESVVYERSDDGLTVAYRTSISIGEVVSLPADAIHHIENPNETVGAALHLYGGDLPGLAEHRTLWSAQDQAEIPFSFPALVQEAVRSMHRDGNEVGLKSIAQAIPALRPMVESLA